MERQQYHISAQVGLLMFCGSCFRDSFLNFLRELPKK